MQFGVFVSIKDGDKSNINVTFVKPAEVNKFGFNDRVVKLANLQTVLLDFLDTTYNIDTLFNMRCTIEHAIKKVIGNIDLESFLEAIYKEVQLGVDKPLYETEFDDAEFILHFNNRDYYLRDTFTGWVIGIVHSDILGSATSISIDYLLDSYDTREHRRSMEKFIHPDIVTKALCMISKKTERRGLLI